VRFDVSGRRDYRGLRTILDMSGGFQGRYMVSNQFDEPMFVLFKCPHPRTEDGDNQSLQAGELRLQASTAGVQESSKEAWFWSGVIDQHTSASIDVSYTVASLKGVSYRVASRDGGQVKQLRVAIHRKDLGSMRFESGDGAKRPTDDTVVWERRDFLTPDFFSASIEESRNLFGSMSRLLEIGPVVTLLFLVALISVILARQHLTPVQLATITAGYGVYFPLILYLSANLSFHWALLIAVLVPGVLLVNYARWLLGGRLGLVGGVIFLSLYQVFPTLAALAGWNRGMVLLCLGIVTLAVLINLQNRALRHKAQLAAAAIAILMLPANTVWAQGQVQVILPAELSGKLPQIAVVNTNSQVAFEPAEYRIVQEAAFFRIEARVPFQVVRAGETAVPLFTRPVYLQESRIESPEADLAGLVASTNRINFFAHRTGQGTLKLVYRAPIENQDGKSRVQIPLVLGPSGNVRLESPRNDIEVLTGTLWSKTSQGKSTIYDAGVAVEEALALQWGGGGIVAGDAGARNDGAREFYGIGLTRAQNLTIINSDGSCIHFGEFELPVSQSDEFRLKLPAKARLISVSVNGTEVNSPVVQDQVCRVRLPAREAQQTLHRGVRVARTISNRGHVGMGRGPSDWI